MEIEEYSRIATVEDDHWWYRNTRALAHDLLEPWLTADMRILDAGCGPGGNGARFGQYGTVVGVDMSPHALAYVRANHPFIVPVRASVDALPFEEGAFDVALVLTVLYNVDDDARALRELARVVRPGGVMVLMEPAFEVFARSHDATVHGRRRYRRRALVGSATRAGFRVERATYAYSFLAPPAAALGALDRLRKRRHTPGESDVNKRTLDKIFAPLARVERGWLTRHDVAVGTSLVLVAVRAPGPLGP